MSMSDLALPSPAPSGLRPSTPASALQALTGQVRLRVAQGLPAIHNSRSELAARLAPGRRADDLPGLLAALYTLCAHAHRSCAQQAIAAARSAASVADAGQAQALQLATLREQMLRISHDWPRQLPGARLVTPSASLAVGLLRGCPVWQDRLAPEAQLAAMAPWLATHWLGMTPAQWLAQHEADPTGWAAAWAQTWQAHSPVAALLHGLQQQSPPAPQLATPGATLDVLDQPEQDLPALASLMSGQPGFCLQPTWQGQPASTGPWSRHHDPLRGQTDMADATAWSLLLARLVEVLRLVSPAGLAWLSQGALALPEREGLAWCEMARGLLLHWVRLSADGQRVEAYRVLAPTEWNFHPGGALARSLAGLDPAAPAAPLMSASLQLAVAYDPCVDFVIELPDTDPMSSATPYQGNPHA